MSKLVSVILTGGKSSRMGYENKSFLKIKDKSFIEILIESLQEKSNEIIINANSCLLYTSPSPRDLRRSRMPSSA